MSRGKIEFSKFTIVGGINFLFTFVLFYLFVRIWQLNYVFALVAVSLIGMVLTYYLNRVWTFQLEGRRDHGSRLFKYIVSGLASIALNAIALRYIVEKSQFDPFLCSDCIDTICCCIEFLNGEILVASPKN